MDPPPYGPAALWTRRLVDSRLMDPPPYGPAALWTVALWIRLLRIYADLNIYARIYAKLKTFITRRGYVRF